MPGRHVRSHAPGAARAAWPLAAGIAACEAGTMTAAPVAAPSEVRTHPIGLVPAVLVCGAAVLLFGFLLPLDLLLIALGQVIISTISLQADITYPAMVRFAVVLGLAVAVPYVISRYWYGDRVIRFPWRTGRRWTRTQWIYLVAVIVAAWLILPFYFITSGVYQNWPTVTAPDEIARLFVGVNAVGTWDELFFICTVFALLRRHFPTWQANLLQTIVFVSFLWELGYQSWGPLLTIPFALIQGYTFKLTKSLTYVLVVHLIFDAVVFCVIVYAHNGWPAIFPLVPS
jgi:membrane protease YdiL (CAAX protease family)